MFPSANLSLWLLLTLLFIIVNAAFVAFEFALVAMRRSRVIELINEGNQQAKTVLELQNKIDLSVSGAQLGITLASLALGWIGEPAIHACITLLLGLIPVTAGLIVPHGITLALSFFILSTTHVVLGEQVPKCIALRMPEQLILAIARPFRIYCWLTWPMIWFLDRLASGVLCILRVPKHHDGDASIHSAEELEILFEASNAAGELNALETRMLKRVLDLKELTLEDVMVPISEVDAIAEQASLGQLLDVVCNTKHSKLPVFRNTKKTIVGVLHTRDLFDLVRDVLRSLPVMTRLEKMTKTFKFARLMRPVLRVNIKAEPSKVLDEFLKRRIQIAIIVNNDGEMVGMTTFEDLMEHLVGEIYDEYDTPETLTATEAQ